MTDTAAERVERRFSRPASVGVKSADYCRIFGEVDPGAWETCRIS